MDLMFTGRGVEITDEVRGAAQHKLARLERLEPRVTRVDVEFIAEHHPRLDGTVHVEAAFHVPRKTFRAEAEARGLSVANKPDSYDICFIPEGDTQDWIADKLGNQTGEIVDRAGNVLGSHEGSHGFTVGQRKGLSIGRPAADGRPRYVLEIRPKTNTVVVGPQAALAISEMAGSRYTWCGQPPKNTDAWTDILVQVRAHGDAIPAEFSVIDDELVIRVKEPLLGVAPGQTAVLYLGTRVLGQTTIDRTVSAVPVEAEASLA